MCFSSFVHGFGGEWYATPLYWVIQDFVECDQGADYSLLIMNSMGRCYMSRYTALVSIGSDVGYWSLVLLFNDLWALVGILGLWIRDGCKRWSW